jgi:hypothetical protein
MSGADDLLGSLRRSAIGLGNAYVEAIESADDARALACAEQLLSRVADLIPHEDEFNSAHTLLLNLKLALLEVAAGNLGRHPILKGRYKVGGVGQLSASQEIGNGIAAAVMLFLMERGATEDAAAKLVSTVMGISVTTAKNLIASRKRKLLKAMAAQSLERIKRDFATSMANDPARFANKWLREQLLGLVTLSPH